MVLVPVLVNTLDPTYQNLTLRLCAAARLVVPLTERHRLGSKPTSRARATTVPLVVQGEFTFRAFSVWRFSKLP